MAPPPILLLVQHALPPQVQAPPHVVQLVNELVLPSTIDAAVANDLRLVLKAYEEFRPYTVGAMDGAAANGRLDILQRLHLERDEGCSSSAFIGAASNGHLEVLDWLYEFYWVLRRGRDELTEAAKHGHLDIIQFLLRLTPLHQSDRENLLVTAAGNGHVAVVRVFVRGVFDAHGALAAATANGHVAVVQLLLATALGLHVRVALEKALEGGHIGTIELLAKAAGDDSIELAFVNMAPVIAANTMRLVLERLDLNDDVLGGCWWSQQRTTRRN